MMELEINQTHRTIRMLRIRTELTERHRTFSYTPLRARLGRGTEPSLTATGNFHRSILCMFLLLRKQNL